jgi:hypothetical protein
MKQTLDTHEAARLLSSNPDNGFSYSGAVALVEYLEELEADTSEEIEFDAVAIRYDYSEYKSLTTWADEYGHDFAFDEDMDEEERDETVRDYICDHGQLIEFSGGIIVSSF